MASMYIMIERKGNFLWLADAVLYSTLACLLSFHVIRSVPTSILFIFKIENFLLYLQTSLFTIMLWENFHMEK